PQQPTNAPNFKLDPEQLNRVSGGMDFTKSISRDDLSKVAAGGEEAVGALVNVLNKFGQQVFSTSAQFSSHMTEAGYNNAQQAIDRGLPNVVKQQLTRSELMASNPKLREPALQPLVTAIQSQIAQKHPNATSQEVNAMLEQYFSEVGKTFAKPDQQAQKPSGSQEYDFSSFLQG
ncbi:MAG: hypothetical protein ACK5LJ_04200, partial [Paracoccus sp. (in: a-proteobacteria)]